MNPVWEAPSGRPMPRLCALVISGAAGDLTHRKGMGCQTLAYFLSKSAKLWNRLQKDKLL